VPFGASVSLRDRRFDGSGKTLARCSVIAVCIASGAYVAYFAYNNVIWHLSVRSGWDLAIEDNVLWNLLNGGPFFKATPETGPIGSHFARHAALITYLFAPIYALHPSAETVLVIQAAFIGFAAIPLYLFAKNRIGPKLAALVAILYLMHPALQEGNLYEMHYTKVGTLPFFMTIWLLDTKRYRWALVFSILTVLVREDVATWIILLGLFGLFAGYRTSTCSLLAFGGALYVGIVKFWAMPLFSEGNEELLFMYQGLLPVGKSSFGWAMLSAFTNPAFLLKNVLTIEKLVFVLQIFVPLYFLPFRHKIAYFACLPGFVFCLLSTNYGPLVDIHFQYATHFLTPLYPALVVCIQSIQQSECGRGHLWGTMSAFTFATLLCSSQFGSVIQRNISYGGPMHYKFGWDDEGKARYQAMNELLPFLPKRATVAASALTLTQVSARPDAYGISLGLWDAEYVISAISPQEIMNGERERLLSPLQTGSYGVVAIRKPFFLMRRGHDTALNAEVLRIATGQGQ
jgi:uncharacterized membrane protein